MCAEDPFSQIQSHYCGICSKSIAFVIISLGADIINLLFSGYFVHSKLALHYRLYIYIGL